MTGISPELEMKGNGRIDLELYTAVSIFSLAYQIFSTSERLCTVPFFFFWTGKGKCYLGRRKNIFGLALSLGNVETQVTAQLPLGMVRPWLCLFIG
jgi:hypothetical protein